MIQSYFRRFSRLWLRAAAMVMALITFLAPVFMAGPAQARSFQDILDSGELRVCFAPIHPSVVQAEPEDCREDCRFSGPAFDAARAFTDFLGDSVTMRALRIDWDEQFFSDQGRTDRDAEYVPALLDSGRCDLYPNNLTRNAWRLQKMDIVTMFTNRMMVLVNAESGQTIRGPSELGGKIAVVEKDTSYHTWLQDRNQTIFVNEPVDIRLQPTADGLNNLAQGKADFTVIDADAAFWIIRNQFPDLIMAFPVGSMEEVGWGIRKESPELRQALQDFFDQQRAGRDSALNATWNRHFGMNLNQFISLLGSMQD
ncbi:transglycosylase SLT domain-containing protein [Desulfonatronum thiodismutans]|uniref:transporter substrate-binding domain-containing protein n=1 Tax=Desulfonatronum thiodismutans TaxID=159290 RepID=UPI0004ABEDA3|nr:transporter substrate-binding domain-containing protein [Desulfonatronum thiodismutans]